MIYGSRAPHAAVRILLTAMLLGTNATLAATQDVARARSAEANRIAMLARAAESFVCVFETPARDGGGSGVIITPDGYGLTNYHVIAAFIETRRGFGGLADGRLVPLEVIGIDPGGDIALFKLDAKPLPPPLPVRPTRDLRVGQRIFALGNPFLLAEDFTPSISMGIVSGLHRYQYGQGNLLEYADCLQVTAAINPGNSGGPIIDETAHLVAIAGRASFEERGRVNVGLGYGVPIEQIRRFLPALRAGRLCLHGTLGATVQEIGDDLVINAVQDLSPADLAGLEPGDVLLAIDDEPVRTANEFNNRIAILPAGWPVTLAVRRDAQRIALHARLEPLMPQDLPLFITDMTQNHTELRRMLALFRDKDLKSGQAQGGVRWIVEHRRGNGDWQPGWPDDAIANEFEQLAATLLHPPDITLDWDHRGGDAVDDRLAAVIEHRSDLLHYRWKLDFDRGTLLAATVGHPGDPEETTWHPHERRQFGEFHWPARWTRTNVSGESLEIRITDVRPDAPADAPAEEEP